MTSDAKRALSSTIRSLRARLLENLHAATETAYRLSVHARDAGLDEAARARRNRLEAWVAEQLRAQGAAKTNGDRSADDFRREAEKQAAYTLLNRLVMLRLMEAPGPSGEPLRAPAVVTGGWESRAYRDFRQLAPELVRGDETEGYAFLLRLTFEDLATELPGLYGPAGVADLVPIPAATLRHIIDALNTEALETCWTDDMTLGWVYQYWNDPEREALDDKLNGGGKVEPHEIASKTQMFTERYMVDWLLQNSLGPMWLAMCQKHGWTPEVQADGTFDRLEERRAEWRAKRASGEVPLTDLMPLQSDAERRWVYYVPQPVPDHAVAQASETVRELKLLDPAVGSGHFLVVAFDLLVALYREEARHRGEAGEGRWSDRAIVERILSHNLHGIDLDPRAAQIAAAALWLKARQVAPDARPERLNLVASNLRLASLADDDPALVELGREVERETGIPGGLTDTLIHALRGADHLGSLLKVDAAVDEALERHEAALGRAIAEQGDLFTGFKLQRQRVAIGRDEAKATLLDLIEGFLAKHTGGDDLGLRLRGEQLAAGVRFVRLVREGAYDLVVANPPYQGTSKMTDTKYVEKTYPLGKADLYAAFLLRGLELVRDGGIVAQVSMNGWMFLKQYTGLRKAVLTEHSVRSMVDLLWGAFEQMRDYTVAMYCLMRGKVEGTQSGGLIPTPRDEQRDRSISALHRKRAAILCHEGRRTFDPAALKVVPEWPLVYWWESDFIRQYASLAKLADAAPVRNGLSTQNNTRFLRLAWEVSPSHLYLGMGSLDPSPRANWALYIKGAEGRAWLEDARDVVRFSRFGMEVKVFNEELYGSYSRSVKNEVHYFEKGVAFALIGSGFTARAHRYRSIFGHMGASVFPGEQNLASVVCLLNSSLARSVLSSLNPGVHFLVGDVNRLPLFPMDDADAIFAQVEAAFATHESHREPSVEFKYPGPSPWRHAQDWAQTAVDRPESEPLLDYIEQLDRESPADHLSFAFGVALGRFDPEGKGVLDPTTADVSQILPHGVLFLDRSLDTEDRRDSLGHPAAAPLHTAWSEYGPALGTKRGLRDWLALDFFKDVHKGMYENRPIHWPLSSSDKTFVAWVNIHRMNEQTLRVLLADHLVPTLARLDGELSDLRSARDSADKKASRAAERQYDRVLKTRDELQAFIAGVEQCADRGAPPTDNKCLQREQDARYEPSLDDGVMINSAGLWPLLDPQWKDPKKWWKELATAQGRKDYDWSHLAMRYWSTRVDRKCQQDPSLAVAHGCFWRYHPERAWSWELRLQDEVGPEFKIEEAPYQLGGRDLGDGGDRPHRDSFLRDHPIKALVAIEKEAARRMGRGKSRKLVPEMRILETGLWPAHAEALWNMELRLAEKQGAELRILAPDEPEARAAFESCYPQRVSARKDFLANLVPPVELFEDEDAYDDAETSEENDT
ncbi:BREX-6 system adenine-specific DNA-methyltransferase PglX [Streptomyces phaeoluteigriseus]|uniref:site-specific DNA-methyltransferase (adenine-specific) n=1 Tax=Streptomyces phaeoluteigriseus TaxID=114686 RepID=A0ABY4Z2J0_9ACTN|nr:BREX-6 system adenine-specific DNA-methyltransferase PglX [Streptomyces phaeoluteigriseus]USQ82557.1 BREX-6 system adenine-specific DNA-methyltransferase PglX [Streptomyces phaeoluteigriseus]